MIDSVEFTPYPREKEVLLIDGCKVMVEEVIRNKKTKWLFGSYYTLIKLSKSPI